MVKDTTLSLSSVDGKYSNPITTLDVISLFFVEVKFLVVLSVPRVFRKASDGTNYTLSILSEVHCKYQIYLIITRYLTL